MWFKSRIPVHYSALTPEEQKEISIKHRINSYVFVFIGSIIYSLGIVWVLQLCGFVSGGVTGLSQIIIGLVSKYGTNEKLINFFSNNLGTFVLILNIPMLLFAWKGLSKRFVFLTLESILIQTIVINLLSMYTISPFVYFIQNASTFINNVNSSNSVLGLGLIDVLSSGSFRFFKAASEIAPEVAAFKTAILPGTRFILAVFGGIFTGSGISLCLKAGGSSGGLDIILNYLFLKKRVSFSKLQSIIDTFIISASAIFSVENVLFTLIRLFASTQTIGVMYNEYKTARLEVVTSKVDDLTSILLSQMGHGMTLYKCIGAYTHTSKDAIVIYVSRFEVRKYVDIINDVDPGAFIAVVKADIWRSNFNQKAMV